MVGYLNYGAIVDSRNVGDGTGLISWRLDISNEGAREYTIVVRVRSTRRDLKDGPEIIANTPGLPLIGSPWRASSWGLGSDFDFYARCTPYMRVTPVEQKQDLTEFWDVELKYSTRPRWNCRNEKFQDPISEPQKFSGSFVKKTREARYDKDGDAIKSSSHETIHGPSVEFDDLHPTVTVQQNVLNLELSLMAQLARRTVNGVFMWGLGTRKVRLANASWSRMVTGPCAYFFTRTFEFEIDYNTFDRSDVVDEGTKALGRRALVGTGWEVPAGYSADNPLHFDRYTDKKGEIAHVMLDGYGKPLGTADNAVIPMCRDVDDGGKGGVKYYSDVVNIGAGDEPVDYIRMLGIRDWV